MKADGPRLDGAATSAGMEEGRAGRVLHLRRRRVAGRVLHLCRRMMSVHGTVSHDISQGLTDAFTYHGIQGYRSGSLGTQEFVVCHGTGR